MRNGDADLTSSQRVSHPIATMAAEFVRYFAPDVWNYARKFQVFMGSPFKVDFELKVGATSVVAHHEKYELLGAIANEFVATIHEDEAEFEARGYTPSDRTRSFAALTETMIAEQYSMLDGLRRAIFSVFRGVSGIQNHSTQTLFERAARHGYGSPPSGHPGEEFFPELIGELTHAQDAWFPNLAKIRTLTTHGETGRCHRDRKTNAIVYWHGVTGHAGDPLRIDNVVNWVNATHDAVVRLAEFFFERCFLALKPLERPVMCGLYNGRVYERMVAASGTLSLNDGRCLSRGWFETEPTCSCPMSNVCGAYDRPVPKEERDAHYRQPELGRLIFWLGRAGMWPESMRVFVNWNCAHFCVPSRRNLG